MWLSPHKNAYGVGLGLVNAWRIWECHSPAGTQELHAPATYLALCIASIYMLSCILYHILL